MTAINLLDKEIIQNNLRLFREGIPGEKDQGRKPWARYASFDYCFNYFQNSENKKELAAAENMEHSCLQLAFYLASWGMLRGSTFLLQYSIRFYQELIVYISEKEAGFWEIDVPNYDADGNIAKLLQCGKDIKLILSKRMGDSASEILITKIMLGVFGCVPAFDTFFKLGSGLGRFNERALGEISKFYREDGYAALLDKQAQDTKTFNFNTGGESGRLYTKAKLVDSKRHTEHHLTEDLRD